jgi:hypothetical protein
MKIRDHRAVPRPEPVGGVAAPDDDLGAMIDTLFRDATLPYVLVASALAGLYERVARFHPDGSIDLVATVRAFTRLRVGLEVMAPDLVPALDVLAGMDEGVPLTLIEPPSPESVPAVVGVVVDAFPETVERLGLLGMVLSGD